MAVDKVLCPAYLPETSYSQQREREWKRFLDYCVAREAWPWPSEAAAPSSERDEPENTAEVNRARVAALRAQERGRRSYTPRRTSI